MTSKFSGGSQSRAALRAAAKRELVLDCALKLLLSWTDVLTMTSAPLVSPLQAGSRNHMR